MVMSTHTVYSIIILEVFVMYFSQLPTYVECTAVAMQLSAYMYMYIKFYVFSQHRIGNIFHVTWPPKTMFIKLHLSINCLTSLIKWVSWIGSLVTFSFGTVASLVMNTLFGMFLAEACKIVQSYKATIVAWEGGSRKHSTHDTLYFL